MEGTIYIIEAASIQKAYIGSTKDLKRRKHGHKSPRNGCSSKEIIEAGDYVFRVLEKKEFASEDEIRKEEGQYQKHYAGQYELVNRAIAGRDIAQWRKDKRAYINEKQVCEGCGRGYTRTNKSHHIKSKYHLNAIAGVNREDDNAAA